MNKRIILALAVLGFNTACKNENEISTPIGYSLTVGQSNAFIVTKESYANSKKDSTGYYLLEKITEIVENGNADVFNVETYTKTKINDIWKVASVHKIEKQPNKVIYYDNSVPKVEMILPVAKGLKWDKNELNNYGKAVVTYKDINQTIGKYNDVFWVEEEMDSSLIHLKRKFKKFSSTGGLIYNENTDLQYCQSNPSCIGKKEIVSGDKIIIKKME